jgi:hypothetical protein
LEKNKQVVLQKIDANTLKLYGIGSGYENKVLSALRWLGLIDENNNATQKLTELRVTGTEFEERLRDVAVDAYNDLISKVPPESSSKEEIINYFMQNNGYSQNRASISLSFLVSLWKLAKMNLSEQLKTPQIATSEKPKGEKKPSPKILKSKKQAFQTTSESGKVIMLVEGKQHDFNLNSDLDRVIFKTLSEELLKKFKTEKSAKVESAEDETDESQDVA